MGDKSKKANNIEKTILDFMNLKETNSGSIDLIKNPDGEYIFLEINPVGQYDMVSVPCNYDIHIIVADKLRQKYQNRI